MAKYKCTMLIQLSSGNQRVGGWSESLYIDRASMDLALAQVKRLALLRAAILPASAAIIGTRSTLVSNPGMAQSVPQNMPGVSGNPTDVPQMALLLKLFTVEGTQRGYIIRGIPDDYVKLGEYAPDTAFTAAMNSFQRGLTGWLVRARDRANPTLPLISVSDTGVVTTAAAHGLVLGNVISFYRTRNFKQDALKGNFTVDLVPTATTFRVTPWAGQPVTKGAYRRVTDPAFYSILEDSRIQRAVVRKVGKPFFQYAGRS